jgi:1-deoxy-D-xylulose-5-phosphate reductoisomerase
MKKKISILGSTGSVGVNTLKVINNISKEFDIVYLTGNTNSDLMIKQCIEFNPKSVVMINEEASEAVKKGLSGYDINVLSGRESLLNISRDKEIDLVLNALVGYPGMEPTLEAVKAGVNVALSNKESLVVAGDLITTEMKKTGANIFPVDSEHSAIWQCMVGESLLDIEKIILTGSGGPFRTRPINTFVDIKVSEALNHPNWEMGKKITIDSATMMNKGLEVIEAYWLFNIDVNMIDIVVHPQSIIHSMVEFKDSSIKAQMGVPDMKVPIQYALTYPNHISAPWERLDFKLIGNLSFEAPDFDRFPCIKLAYMSLDRMGSTPAILNMANDYSVYKFLNSEIKFTEIPKIIEAAMKHHQWVEKPDLDYIKELDNWTKDFVNNFD